MELKSAKRAIAILRKIKLKNSIKYKNFLREHNRKIIYLSETDHSNLGDHAILYAQHRLIDPKTEAMKYCFTRRECLAALDLIQKGVRKNDLILIPGGGWIGTLWENSGELFLRFLEFFKDNKIIVFPQTIYFSDSEYGKRQKERFYNAVNNCRDITLYVRDTKSYEFLREEMPKPNNRIIYGLAPDMVLSLQPEIPSSRKDHVLFVTRKDKEKVTDDKLFDLIKTELEYKGLEIRYGDTHALYSVGLKHREKALFEKWKEFSEARLVITDRLHGMLFAAINSTPCLSFDNLSNKVEGVYNEWLKENPYVIFLPAMAINDQKIKESIDILLNIKGQKFSTVPYKVYFNKMLENIKD